MGFDLGVFVNNVIDSILDSTTVLAVAKNPVYTAIVIVLVLMLIIIIVFRDADTEEHLMTMTFRAGFWMFLSIVGILLLHNKVLMTNVKQKEIEGRYEEVFKPVSVDSNQYVPVPMHVRKT
jgi:phosphatidylglycerophosphate synthase